MFSKYEIYTSVESVYCYEDSTVLINRLGLHEQLELKRAEEEITAIKQYEMLLNPIKGHFTKTHLCRIHRFLFEDIYDFAGKVRKEQIGKANTWFYPPDLINRELNRVFLAIKENDAFKRCGMNDFYDRLAYVMAELNIIHPFREGNGRSIREFIRLMALYHGQTLNWGNVVKEDLLDSSIASVDDYTVLIPVLKSCVASSKLIK